MLNSIKAVGRYCIDTLNVFFNKKVLMIQLVKCLWEITRFCNLFQNCVTLQFKIV